MIQPILRAQLDELLTEPAASVHRREQSAFDEQAAPFQDSLVLFGAGGLGRKTLAGLRRLGIEPLAFADNNPALWGSEVDGVRVLSLPDAANRFGQSAAFVVTIWRGQGTETMADRRRQLADLNCSRVIPFGQLYWKHPDIFLPHYAFDLPHKVYEQAGDVRKALDLWFDDASRNEYLAQVRWRTIMDFDGLSRPVSHETYFPHDLTTLSPEEVFVDGGAFDGDTIRAFLRLRGESFAQIIAFEPDPDNFRKLQHYASTLPPTSQRKLDLHAQALGALNAKVRFESSGTEASAVGSGDLEVDCVTLDRSLTHLKPSYVKMDIEGSELDALLGAQNVIRQNLPVLAICVYHHQDHLWRIPLQIHSLCDEYRLFLRPHLLEVWDLVCYAIPASRLIA